MTSSTPPTRSCGPPERCFRVWTLGTASVRV
jgi:hypothetical protein